METKLNAKAVKKAAKEYNKVVILDTPVDLKSESLEKDLYEALEHVEEGDEFSEETDAIFNELKIKFTPKPKVKKAKTVEVGTTVELDVETDKIKSGKKMKKEKESGANPQVDAARVLLGKSVTKPELMKLIEGKLFTKKQVETLKGVTNFLSLKKQMTDSLDQDVVAEVKAELKAELKAAPKPASKPKVKKDNPLVNSIKSALKVKQLKTIAKENDQFNWKKLKKLEEFDEIQEAMLKGVKPAASAKPKKVMIPNPLYDAIMNASGKKGLKKIAKLEDNNFVWKELKKFETATVLLESMKALIPAKIEKGTKSGGTRAIVNHIDQEARRKRICEMVDGANMTQKEIKAVLIEEFPEEGKSHTNANILSESKSTAPWKDGQRWERFGIGRLVVEDENKCFTWADAPKPKKEKKAKKNKKGNKKNKK